MRQKFDFHLMSDKLLHHILTCSPSASCEGPLCCTDCEKWNFNQNNDFSCFTRKFMNEIGILFYLNIHDTGEYNDYSHSSVPLPWFISGYQQLYPPLCFYHKCKLCLVLLWKQLQPCRPYCKGLRDHNNKL